MELLPARIEDVKLISVEVNDPDQDLLRRASLRCRPQGSVPQAQRRQSGRFRGKTPSEIGAPSRCA